MTDIVPLDDALWPSARALLARTPMSAASPLRVSRGPALARAHPSMDAVALDRAALDGRGAVVGLVHARIEERRIEGGVAALGYFGDLRVDPAARRSGIARQLLDDVAGALQANGVHAGFALVNAGNDAMLALLAGGRCGLRGSPARAMTTRSAVLLPWLSRPRSTPALREVAPDDVDLDAWAQAIGAPLLAPAWRASTLAALLRAHPEIRVLARRDAPARAVCALWDQRALRQVHLPSTSTTALLQRGWNVAARATGAPRLEGAIAATELTLVDPAADLRAVVASALPLLVGAGCHVLNAIAAGGPTAPASLRAPSTTTWIVPFGVGGARPPALAAGAHLGVDLGFL